MDANEGWRKSTRSQGSGSNCVEARMSPEGPQLSDSKLAHARPIITLDEVSYVSFIDHVKSHSLHSKE